MPLSDLITWTFNEPVSHVAFVFDDKWLLQSNLFGVNIRWFHLWKKKQHIIFQLKYELPLEKEEQIFQALLDAYSEDWYDYLGFLYFVWRGFLYKVFKIQLPKKNPWVTSGHLCTKLVEFLPRWLTNLPEDLDLEIVTPYKLFMILKEAKWKKDPML